MTAHSDTATGNISAKPTEWTRAESLFAASYFPLVMISSIGGCMLLIDGGMDLGAAFLIALLAAYVRKSSRSVDTAA